MSNISPISFADYQALTNLDASYWAIADGRHHIGAEKLFIAEGVLTLGNLELQGRDAIAKFFADRETQNKASGRVTRHVAGPRTVELTGAESAVLRSVVLVFAGSGELPLEAGVPSTIADVTDHCVKHDKNSWLFQSRIVKPVFVGAGAAKFAR
ncbi:MULTISPECIES: nuclear transport factor 2 family protein [unclassified Burkholderia]|uniref:nuclear transport factor 2 family protein n=1 Tax=unclassified Burkholderia TaxID=2613784 RepID=UPI002AB13E81|nr:MULTISPECIES: nuclear transport factor 2 family protein [unclassified Burkholderia]